MISIISRPGAFNSPVISPIYINNPLSSTQNSSEFHSETQDSSILVGAPASPLLNPTQSLLKKVSVHFVLDPIVFGGTSIEGSFAARYDCLVLTEKVEQIQIGSLVSIRV